MKSAEIRNKFLRFFESKGHTIVPKSLQRLVYLNSALLAESLHLYILLPFCERI